MQLAQRSRQSRFLKAARQHSGCADEHDRHGNLKGDETAAQRLVQPIRRGDVSMTVEESRQSGSCRHPAWDRSEENRRDHRDEKREAKHTLVHSELLQCRESRGWNQYGRHQAHEPQRDHNARARTECPEQERFDHQLPQQTRSRRADRYPNPELAHTPGVSCKQEICDVHARNGDDEQNEAEQREGVGTAHLEPKRQIRNRARAAS